MDSPKQAETSPLTGHETPHRTPIDAALDHDDPKGKLLFSFPLSNYFRPWTLAWGIIAASITMHAHTGDVLGHITVAFTWVFVAWTILATASHHVHSSYSPPRELRVNLGAFVCTCTGGQDEDDGEEPGRSKNRLSGQALVDLIWSAIFIVFASLSTIQYDWNSKEMVISSLFIIAFSQLGISMMGFLPVLKRFRFHLYKEDENNEGLYRIQLPQDPARPKATSTSRFA